MFENFKETVFVIVINKGNGTEYFSKNYYKNKHSKRSKWSKRMINTEVATNKLNKAARFNSIETALKQAEYLKLENVFGIAEVTHELVIVNTDK